MIPRFYKPNVICRQLGFLISILLILSGCNIALGASPTPKTTIENPSSVPTRVPPDPNSSTSFQIDNLLYVYSSTFVGCLTNNFENESLILATDRLTYDQAEVNQISAFIDSQGAFAADVGHIDRPPIPETLRYVTGSVSHNVIAKGDGQDSTYCYIYLTLTNVSNETLKIPQINLRYLRSAEPNTQLFRLINVCSIDIRTQKDCPSPMGGGGADYATMFTIGMGPANTTYSGQVSLPHWDEGPSIPTLRPGDSARIDLNINIKDYESGLSVSAIPEIVVISPEETQTVALTQLKWDFAIAAPRNVSCYALKENTFVQQTQMISPPQYQGGSWCV